MPIDQSAVKWDATPDPFESALAAEGVSGKLAGVARSIYQQESGGGRNTKTSNAGAVGGMQIIPDTFASVADKGWNIADPVHNARAGIRYLKQLDQQSGGDAALTAAGYYGGPGGMEKARKGVAVSDPRNPKAPNTLQYGQQVAARANQDGPIVRGLNAVAGAVLPSAQAETAPPAKLDLSAVQWDEPAQEPGMASELGRQVGLTARAGVKGALALPGMFADAASGLVNTGLDLTAGKGNGYRFPSTSAALDGVMNKAGLPQPRNATERVVQDVTGAMAGTGGGVALGKLLAGNAAPVVQQVGNMLSAGPGMQTAAAVTSAGASGVTRESGGGAGAQTLAGLAGALAPSVAVATGSGTVRGLLRGGEAGRAKVNDNIKLFNDAAGTSPSVGQATEGRLPRALESMLSKTPGSAGVMQRSAQGKADAMARSVKDTAESLAPGSNAVAAGESIEKGVLGFKEGVKTVQKRLYDTLDQHIPAATPLDVSNTRATLAKLNEGIPGADNISKFFKNARIKGIDDAMVADLEAAMKATAPAGSGSGLMNAAKPRLEDGRLPYEAIKKLRTLVGNEITDNSLMADVPMSKWKAVYAALSEDLGVAAKQAGPQAEQSWQWANQYTKGQLGRLEDLSKVIGKDSPEKIFNAAMAGTADGTTVIKRVVDAIPKENRKDLAAAVLKRMGQATAGNQNAAGDAFSAETFLTNINKLSPEARTTLFGRLGLPEVPEKLNKLAQMAGNMREGSKVFANPSGTQQALSLQAAGGGSLGALLLGHPGVAAAAGGTMAGSNLLAKKMTNPEFVKWLGQSTKLSPSVSASEVNALAQLMGR
jgi:hypothetical protein